MWWKGSFCGLHGGFGRGFAAAAESREGRVSRLGKRGGDAEGEERAPLWSVHGVKAGQDRTGQDRAGQGRCRMHGCKWIDGAGCRIMECERMHASRQGCE